MPHNPINTNDSSLGMLDALPVVRADNVPDIGRGGQPLDSVPTARPQNTVADASATAEEREPVTANTDQPVAGDATSGNVATSPFNDDREYRFCLAVVDNPMRPSSEYPGLAGMSPKTAQPIRARLVALDLIREHKIETGKRGGKAIRLEPLPGATSAVATHEAAEGSSPR